MRQTWNKQEKRVMKCFCALTINFGNHSVMDKWLCVVTIFHPNNYIFVLVISFRNDIILMRH